MSDALNEFLEELASESEDVLFLLKEATESINYYRRLLERFELDALTGLPSSNKFRDLMDDIENRAKTIGIIFFDVNDLKMYNDTKGHNAGDALIQKAAESFMSFTSPTVQTYRIGGDEFATVMINCKEDDIEKVMIKWREELAKLNTLDDGITCSVSAGYAFGDIGFSHSEVLQLADDRMYENKKEIKAAKGQVPR
ncbi:MAG: GGDEF domain-containing protein [Oscillospiraceae bacterium]|jgi:diguanylate cyclase (GGDEF)-like protein|nr:GGDEF domain-containing protein [Oscillospiraceae bacterium]